MDANRELSCINTTKYNRYAYAHHFTEYCEESLQTELMSKMSNSFGTETRTDTPLYGKIDFDESGKLVGNWFHSSVDQTDPMTRFEQHLSFVYDKWDASQIRVGIGGTLSITATVYSVIGNSPDPATIDVGESIVYQLQGTPEYSETSLTGTIKAEVINNTWIKVETFSGHQTDPAFTSSAQYYMR